LAAGVTSGCTAALICNPLDLLKVRRTLCPSFEYDVPLKTIPYIKTRMQAQASGANASVGFQHGYSGVSNGLFRVAAEEGITGMYKGLPASMLRLALGSAGQVS
jgi:hypothetical protein